MAHITFKRARSLTVQYTAARGADADKVAQRMVETGECVWHAAAQVSGKPCWCNDCAKGG